MKKSLIAVALVAAAACAAAAAFGTAVQTAVFGAVAAAASLPLLAPGLPQRLNDAVFGYMARTGLVLGMTTLAANKPRPYELGNIQEYPVIAADIIYEGAAVGEDGSGYARPLVAADPFLGFAETYVDNSAGAAGDKRVRVRRSGQVQLAVAGATAITANDGVAVYASDDDTFTLTSTSNTLIGKVSRWLESGVCIVDFKAATAS
ncbi:MAG: cytoplasmic protein [Ramlibacter sp.]|jgi:hypothetical protein|nr:cytoplasmic protein [Ramlibacter sp.]